MVTADIKGVPVPRMAQVWDATATRGPRTHEFGGKKWTFNPDEPTDVPLDIARLVAHIPEFRVIGPDGEVYRQAPQEDTPKALPALRNDQVVASLEELTIQALRARASAWSGHEGYAAVKDRPGLIRFIMGRQGEASVASEGEAGEEAEIEFDPEDDGEAGGLSMAAVTAILARQRAEASAEA